MKDEPEALRRLRLERNQARLAGDGVRVALLSRAIWAMVGHKEWGEHFVLDSRVPLGERPKK
jgi:hypothetical protein